MRAAGETQTDVPQQVFEAPGRVGVGEELDRVPVLFGGLAAQNLGKVRGEIRLRDGP